MTRRWLLDPARAIAVGQPAGLMGIINVTPDSFSDGGRHATPAAAAEAARALVAAGADWLDVGGESTRPGAQPVDAETEIARVVPAIAAIRAAGVRVPLSVDTSKGRVAEAALAAGADAINDIGGGRDPELLAVAARARCPLILMHMQGTPQTMQLAPRYQDVVGEVEEALRQALARAVAAGVAEQAIVLDPGIGFGKTRAHNLALLAALPRLAALGRPLLVGVSRKSLIGALTGIAEPAQRDAASHVAHALLAPHCALLRVHDVAGARAALRVAAALREAA
ncbi:MAG: dihydropteroate synthase [Planctomycetota bacterium]|nr:dihydropteroate synthase [Planctomycetota bacterium]MCX8040798.1 dihydropteroate synthase [Planctomycetota bacterium]MDW8372391.1 dihydropteroate synthase [Planctomycetota bacterium]